MTDGREKEEEEERVELTRSICSSSPSFADPRYKNGRIKLGPSFSKESKPLFNTPDTFTELSPVLDKMGPDLKLDGDSGKDSVDTMVLFEQRH